MVGSSCMRGNRHETQPPNCEYLSMLCSHPVPFPRYVPPIGSGSGERTLDQLRTVAEIEEEMMKQESLLGHLHAQVTAGNVSRRKEESLWEAQRIVTLLKVRSDLLGHCQGITAFCPVC